MSSDIKDFYNENYESFDTSRRDIWEKVGEFLEGKENSSILDAGCGNGIYMEYMNKNKIKTKGIDISEKFVNLCKSKELDVSLGDVRNISFRDNAFDFIICIAVIHHLDSITERQKSIDEMLRVCKPKGKILLSVWAYEGNEDKFSIGDNFVKWGNSKRYYHIFDKKSLEDMILKYDVDDYFLYNGNWFFILNK